MYVCDVYAGVCTFVCTDIRQEIILLLGIGISATCGKLGLLPGYWYPYFILLTFAAKAINHEAIFQDPEK